MAERPKVQFYIHETARPKHQRRAMDLSDHLSDVGVARPWQRLTYPLQPIPDEIGTAVVVGGDGSYRSVAVKMHERAAPGTVLTAGGGSQNAFRASLIKEGSTVSPEALATDPEQSDILPFKPTWANEHLFLHTAEYGPPAEFFSRTNESHRNSLIPRDARMLFTVLQTGFHQATEESDGPILRTFSTLPDIKSVTCFPEQEMYSDEVTMATFPRMTKKEFIIFAKDIIAGIAKTGEIPQDLLAVERSSEIHVPDPQYDSIVLGGDVFSLEPHSGLVVSRKGTKPLRVAALYAPS